MSDDIEWEEYLETNPELAAGWAVQELHAGRLEMLATHIRKSNFNIAPMVARKLLALIEETDANCLFVLTMSRRKDLKPAYKDPHETRARNAEMAYEVAAMGGFERSKLARACHIVGEKRGLKGGSVRRIVVPLRDHAIAVVEERQLRELYAKGKVDFLGHPISPETTFADTENDA